MRYPTKLIGVMAALVLVLAGGTPASASTWTLQDIDQRICLRPNSGFPNTYVLAPVVGTWSSTITTGTRNFPPGSTNNGSPVFPPGSHDGSYVNGFIGVSIAAAPEGDHIGEVWATDGTVTQAVPVLLRYSYKTNCWA